MPTPTGVWKKLMSPPRRAEGFETPAEEVTARVVETARERELKWGLIGLRCGHLRHILTDQALLRDQQGKWFLEMNQHLRFEDIASC